MSSLGIKRDVSLLPLTNCFRRNTKLTSVNARPPLRDSEFRHFKKKEDPYANRFHVKETVSGTDGVAHMLDATPTHLRSKIRKLQLQPAIGRDSLW